ncbi:MAG: PHP domain-containing protein [Clostridia bacterium]|nr:PHP domain-containing protein [Clostridia bacterium]
MNYFYDFHIHSCLSPCADDDNTPNNIAGMASLCGLNIIALTDHNSCRNCPAFFEAAKRYSVTPVAGMELTTSEDIHVICLFENLEDALCFNDETDRHRILIPNKTEIFGNQLILDGEDNTVGEEKYFLTNATDISIENAPALVEKYGGICYPAHIDRPANGIIATLGVFPETPHFDIVEFASERNIPEYTEKYSLEGKRTVIGSDAHRLTDMRDGVHFFELDCKPGDDAVIRQKLFELLRQSR